mmetsp:Transcript_31521/g.94311  ORF Transcript_31521/g.94311 Transcript_31521/m.94311 type:complete len:219 (+) Transcript_31521:241-897(+)
MLGRALLCRQCIMNCPYSCVDNSSSRWQVKLCYHHNNDPAYYPCVVVHLSCPPDVSLGLGEQFADRDCNHDPRHKCQHVLQAQHRPGVKILPAFAALLPSDGQPSQKEERDERPEGLGEARKARQEEGQTGVIGAGREAGDGDRDTLRDVVDHDAHGDGQAETVGFEGRGAHGQPLRKIVAQQAHKEEHGHPPRPPLIARAQVVPRRERGEALHGRQD